jgi:LysM repeat protein
VTTPSGVDLITIQAVDPPGPTVYCRHGDGPTKYMSASGWQFTKRPRRVSMTEFMGPDPYQMIVPIIFGNGLDITLNIDPTTEILRGIQRNPVGPRDEPAVVTIKGQLLPPLAALRWVIQDFEPTVEMRSVQGVRYYAAYTLTLNQYEPTDLTVAAGSSSPGNLSPAEQVAQSAVLQSSGTLATTTAAGTRAPVPDYITYTVKNGDTLVSIARRLMGSTPDGWQQIQQLNGIRDPATIKPGQVIKIPAANVGPPPTPAEAVAITAAGGSKGYGTKYE